MSKNKFALGIALISILIISIPIAYAQTFFGSPIFFILINSLIVGVILFLLQSFLIRGKDQKEQTAVWVAIIVGSLLIGFFFGQQGFIWQHPVFARFFSIYVLVNAIVIGVALYFILGLLDVNKKLGLGSPEGKAGYGILIFIVAVIFAVQIGNQWIWQQSVIRQFVAYLFGPEGILNPSPPAYRLWVFIGSATLLAFFFNNWLMKGGNTKLNVALSIVIASNMASAGVTIRSVIMLGEIVFFIVLADALGTTTTKKGAFNWFLSAFLIGWASAAMTYGTDYQGLFAAPIGWILSWFGFFGPAAPTKVTWWGTTGLVVLLLILIFGGLTFFITRAEVRGRILREGITRLWVKILNKLRRNRATAKIVGDLIEIRDRTLDRELPFVLKDLRLELYTLMNLMLRYEIYQAKYKRMMEIVSTVGKEESILAANIPTKYDISRGIKNLIEGSPIKPLGNAWDLEPIEMEDEQSMIEIKKVVGFARQHYLIYKVMEELKALLETNLTEPTTAEDKDIEARVNELHKRILEPVEKHLENIYGTRERVGRYKRGVERFGAYNKIRGYRLYFLDMYNLYGTYLRGYHFPKPDAVPDLYTWTPKDTEDGIITDIDDKKKVKSILTDSEKQRLELLKKKAISALTPAEKRELEDMKNRLKVYNFVPGTDMLEEVDIYGFSIRDQNNIMIERKDPDFGFIRRWKREDLQEVHKEKAKQPRITDLLNMSAKEWEFYVEDMEKGKYHPYSKRISDYAFVLKGYMNFNAARFERPLTIEEIAFDREALKNPSKIFTFWGKKNYFDMHPDTLRKEPMSPYPVVSLVGLWRFIWDVAGKRIKEPGMADQYKEFFKMEFQDIERAAQETKK